MAENLVSLWQNGGKVEWTREMAAHLMRRAGFGGTEEEIEGLVKMGPQKAVQSLIEYRRVKDDLGGVAFGELSAPGMMGEGAGSDQMMMIVPGAGAVQVPALGRAARGGRAGRGAVMQEMLRQMPEDERRAFNQIQQAAQRAKEQEIRLWWLDRMIRTKRPLEEKMTLFWHGLFVSSATTVRQTYLLYKQNQLFRKNATGNYRVLTHEVAKDPAMLVYLNNNQNVRTKPNENFARELMELFTMGIGNYTEEDIKESARAFTGWANTGDQFVIRQAQHDAGMKVFLGQRGNFNGDQIIEIIFQQAATPKYIATRLLKFFAIDEPSSEIVTALATVVKRSNFDIAPALTALFSSRWFYSKDVMFRQIKSPVQLIVGSLRALGVNMLQPQQVVNALRLMGQELFNSPTVKGWDGGRTWINTSTLFARYNLPAYLGTGRLPATSRQNAPTDARAQFNDFESGWSPQSDLAAGEVATTDGAVDMYIERLLGFKLDARKRGELIEYVNQTGDARSQLHDPITAETDRRTRGLVHLIMSMAEYQLC